MLGIKRDVAINLIHFELRNVTMHRLHGCTYEEIVALNGESIYDHLQFGIENLMQDAGETYDSIMEAKKLVAKIFEAPTKQEVGSAYWRLSGILNA